MMRLAGILSASSKFYNYYVGASMHNANVTSDDPVQYVISTVKSSGSMANLMAHPTIPNAIVATTKNGCESWYIEKISNILNEQLGGKDGMRKLYETLARTGWSLRCELLVRKGAHGFTTHGSLCVKDHIIVHGGTTREERSLTPMELVWLHNEVGEGLLIPEMHVFFLNGKGMSVLDRAFEDANNEGFFGWLSTRDRNIIPPMQNARHSLNRFYIYMQSHGAVLLKAFSSHLVEEFDDPMVVEGFVQHAVTGSSLLEGGEYHDLLKWINEGDVTGPYPYTLDTYDGGSEDIVILNGWEKDQKMLTAGQLLPLVDPGSKLQRFLLSVQLFADSDYAKSAMDSGKPGSNIPKFAIFKQPGSSTQMWICKLENGWYAYSQWLKEVARHSHADKSLSFPPLSRGMALLVDVDAEEPTNFVDNSNCLFKTKFFRYTLLTMQFRSALLDPAEAVRNSSYDEFYDDLQGSARVWNAHSAEVRTGAARLALLYHVFRMSFVQIPVINEDKDGKRKFAYMNEIFHYIRGYVCTLRGIKAPPLEAELAVFMDEFKLPVVSDKYRASDVIKKLSENPATFTDFSINAPDLWVATVHMLFGEHDPDLLPTFQALSAQAGSVKSGRNNSCVKRIEAMTNLVSDFYKGKGIWETAHDLQPLKLIIMPATPGMGKSTILAELCARLAPGSFLKVSSDLPDGTARQNGIAMAIKEANDQLKPTHKTVILDACVIDMHAMGKHCSQLARGTRFLTVEVLLPHNGRTYVNNNSSWYIPESWEGICAITASVLLRNNMGLKGMEGLPLSFGFIAKNRIPVSRTILDSIESNLYPSAFRVTYRHFTWTKPDVEIPVSIDTIAKYFLGISLSNQHGPDGYRMRKDNHHLPELTDQIKRDAKTFLDKVRIPFGKIADMLESDQPQPLSVPVPPVNESICFAPVVPLYTSLALEESSKKALYNRFHPDLASLPLPVHPHITLEYLNTPTLINDALVEEVAKMESELQMNTNRMQAKQMRTNLELMKKELKWDYRVWRSFDTDATVYYVTPMAYQTSSLAGVVLMKKVDDYVKTPHITLYCAESNGRSVELSQRAFKSILLGDMQLEAKYELYMAPPGMTTYLKD